MRISSRQADKNRLAWLLVGFFLYFCVMLYAARYASSIPHQMFALAALLNMGIILTFLFGIVRTYKRMQGLIGTEGLQSTETNTQQSIVFHRRRLKGLWFGAGLYSLIFINGLRLGFAYVGKLPLLTILLAEALNGAILTTVIVELRKVQKRIEVEERLGCDATPRNKNLT